MILIYCWSGLNRTFSNVIYILANLITMENINWMVLLFLHWILMVSNAGMEWVKQIVFFFRFSP